MRVISNIAHSPNVKSMLTSFLWLATYGWIRKKPVEGCIRIRMRRTSNPIAHRMPECDVLEALTSGGLGGRKLSCH